MLGVSFRIRHDCVFGQISQKHPDVPMANWCNYRLEILEYRTRDPAVAESIAADLGKLRKRGFKVLQRSSSPASSQMVLMRCGHRSGTSIDEIIERHGCLVLYPVVLQAGWENYRIRVPDEAHLPKLFERLAKKGELEVTLKRKASEERLSQSFTMSSNELLSELTPKQVDALHAAIEHGYYQVPRKIRTEDIANARKTPRTTFEEHVRKAESKVMGALAPYIAFHAGESLPGARKAVVGGNAAP